MWICPNCGREFKRTNQGHYCGKPPASVDEYILGQAQEIQPVLIRLRNAIRDAMPEAEETIAWSMPTWKRKGKNILHFAVNKNHIAVYADPEAVSYFSGKLNGLEACQGVIRLKPDQDIPFSLISDVAARCFAADEPR